MLRWLELRKPFAFSATNPDIVARILKIGGRSLGIR
jgi:hypothetical protein